MPHCMPFPACSNPAGISPYLHRPHDVNTIRRPLVSVAAARCCGAGHPALQPCGSHTAASPLRSSCPQPQDVNPNGEGLLADLLWADPSPHVSGWVPNPRGVSFIFGLDVARKWLHAQGLRALVRAHMVQQAGFEVLGNNEVRGWACRGNRPMHKARALVHAAAAARQ